MMKEKGAGGIYEKLQDNPLKGWNRESSPSSSSSSVPKSFDYQCIWAKSFNELGLSTEITMEIMNDSNLSQELAYARHLWDNTSTDDSRCCLDVFSGLKEPKRVSSSRRANMLNSLGGSIKCLQTNLKTNSRYMVGNDNVRIIESVDSMIDSAEDEENTIVSSTFKSYMDSPIERKPSHQKNQKSRLRSAFNVLNRKIRPDNTPILLNDGAFPSFPSTLDEYAAAIETRISRG